MSNQTIERSDPQSRQGSDRVPEPDARFDQLLAATQFLEKGDAKGAKAVLAGLPLLAVHCNPEDLRCFLFLRALWGRLNERLDHPGNLYLKEFAFSQIDLFNLIAERMPVIVKAAEVANRLLCCELMQSEDPVLLDIGIGTGRQELGLLRLLAATSVAGRHNRIRIVGIEPSRASLKLAETRLVGAGERLGIAVEFHPFLGCIESLSRDEWTKVARLSRKAVLNEAFALHHVAHRRGAFDLKDAVLRRIRDLEPSLFVMAEPDSDHQSESLTLRFTNAWRHFGLVFAAVDEIRATHEERDAIKVLFFAREIEDILSASESRRTERHESAAMWIGRLTSAGLRMRSELCCCEERTQFDFSENSEPSFDTRRRGNVQFAWKEGYLGIDYRGETIVSILASGA